MANLTLAKLPWYGQLGVFVLLAVAGAGAFYYFYETPLQVELEARAVELSAIRGRITRGQAMARQLPEFRKQIGELELRLEALRPILPDERDVGDLLRRVNTLATQSNLQIRGIKPLPITPREMHAEWPLTLQLEGNYHSLGLFLDRVSKFPRIINIDNVTLTAKTPPSPSASMVISLTATTFVLVDPATQAANAAKKGAAK